MAALVEGLDLPQRTRPPAQQRALVGELKRRILTGRLGAGAKLPPRKQLSASLDVSTATLQRAIDHLVADGFLTTRSTQGTYVCAQLPYQTRIAVAYEGNPEDSRHWTRFHQGVMHAAGVLTGRRTTDGDAVELVNYFDQQGHMDIESVRDLIRDVHTHRLAGVIHVHPPLGLMKIVDLTQWPVPQVMIASGAPEGMSCVYLDHAALLRQALANLARRRPGQRVAVIELSKPRLAGGVPQLLAEARQLGLRMDPDDVQYLPVQQNEAIRGWIRLMFGPRMKTRPDALVITDENLVEPITDALASLSPFPRLDILAHANFPLLPDAKLPVRYLGFDSAELLDRCLQCLDTQGQRRGDPNRVLIEPRFREGDL